LFPNHGTCNMENMLHPNFVLTLSPNQLGLFDAKTPTRKTGCMSRPALRW
jgi:hypothetical protein